MQVTKRKIRRVFIIYWVLLAYIIAALVWWFIALTMQNEQMSIFKLQDLRTDDLLYTEKKEKIFKAKDVKTAQYFGEGATFLLLIIAGAIFVYRAVRRELKSGTDQQNFMMAITHELKTPIAVAKLNLETLQKWKLDETRQKRLLQNTLEETNRLDTLCSNILLSSQMEAGGYRFIKEEQAYSLLVEHCVNNFAARYTQRKLIKNIAPDVFVSGDAFLLQIAVNNLLENAIKYSPKEKPVTISLQKEGQSARLEIRDEGPGIPEAERKRIFKKFYRTGNEATRTAKGTGLGLYLSKTISKKHEGNIAIEDNPGGGSVFVFSMKAEA